MKRTLACLFLVAALALNASAETGAPPASAPPVPSAAPGSVLSGFLPPKEKIEKPYTNEKCLKNCHELPGFRAGGPSGQLQDLHIDRKGFLLSIHAQKGIECVDCHVDADPNFHPRTGYPKVDCRACHSTTPPPGVYPPDALQRLKAKGIKPPPKESRKAEGWMKTAHGKAWLAKNPSAPFCSGCHTAHYQRKADDPGSTVNRANLPKTCGACHADEVRSYNVGGLLARFRISGHGKGDLSNRYDVGECVACHQGEAAHGEKAVTKQLCPTCHRVLPEAEREKGAPVVSSIHSRPLASDQPVAKVLHWAYLLVVWGAAAGLAVFVLFMGFSTLYRSKDQ